MRMLEALAQAEGRSLRSVMAYQNGCMLLQLDSSFTRRAAVCVPCDSLQDATPASTAGFPPLLLVERAWA